MADIELVLKMDQVVAEEIALYECIPKEYENMIIYAIKNGTPLPKGHGRLGDLDALAHKMCMANIDHLESEEVAGLMLWYCDKADATIEADTESEGKA